MRELESDLHLYQPTLYRGEDGSWHRSYVGAVESCPKLLTLDPAAILSILSFNYCCGNRTLLNEIKRNPWLSKLNDESEPILQRIPNHGTSWQPIHKIAENLDRLLIDEAFTVCQGRKEIYVLLSGGLDSRIVAGILAKLVREGKLSSQPVAVTWGLRDSRDVFYSRMVAEVIGFDFLHIELGPENIRQNVKAAAIELGCLVPPHHLHGMLWFKNVSKDALVLAGCYGDSVGRAEFSGRHLLELDYLSPINSFGLIKRDVISFAYRHLMSDLKTLYNRTPGRPRYVLCEHEQQGHYMRGMIAHAMSIINKYCTIYQMFTKPSVYSYMWSIHPALRTDDIYAALLERLDERLIRIPWARTNRALKGITEGACSGLRPSFHEYARWVSGSLYGDLNQYVNPGWFEGIGIFNVEKLQSLSREIRHYKNAVFNLYDVWLWLASFRHFVEYLGKLGKSVELGDKDRDVSGQTLPCVPQGPNRLAREILGRSQVLNTTLKWVRKLARGARKNKLVRKSLQEYRAQLAH